MGTVGAQRQGSESIFLRWHMGLAVPTQVPCQSESILFGRIACEAGAAKPDFACISHIRATNRVVPQAARM